MRRFTALIILLLLLLLFASAAWPSEAECAPERMLKITTKTVYQNLPSNHFASMPKTLYRWGSKHGRLEEHPNPETGIHLLVIVSEPDVWVINQANNTGQHIVDEGPIYEFHAPIVTKVESDYWFGFELGCEISFMEKRGENRIKLAPTGRAMYSHEAEDLKVQLFLNDNGEPIKVEVTGRESDYSVHYLQFETDLEPIPELFQPPAGIAFANQE